MTAETDVLIIGGGTAGMASACALREKNPEKQILLAEKEPVPGGILRQCIHHGFGEQDLTGPEYSAQLVQKLRETGVCIWYDAEVTEIGDISELTIPNLYNTEESSDTDMERTPEIQTGRIAPGNYTKKVHYARILHQGVWKLVRFQSLVLATGCYERPIGSLMIGGTRPEEGIYGAGELQRRMNLSGDVPAGRAVILGGGDIGLIVARRLLLNGVKVERIIEIRDQSPALERNIINCLKAYALPLQTSSHILEIHGEKKLCGVTVENRRTGDREYIPCDLLAVAAGLIPDRMLLEPLGDTWKSWTTLAGNCKRIYPTAEGIVHAVRRDIMRK